jgi:hypothetical protein
MLIGNTTKALGVVAAAVVAAVAPVASATVGIALSDGDATPTSRVVIPGTTFTVTANLVSTGEQVTGVDYYFQVTGAAAGKVRLTDRNVGASPFSDLIKADVGDNGSNPGVEDASVSLLGPRNGLDLGASIANVNVPAGAGTHFLGAYTFSVPATLVPGTYTLSTTSDPGSGWVAGAPLFSEAEFNQHGSFTFTINPPPAPVPEPVVGLGVVAIGGMMLRRRRR